MEIIKIYDKNTIEHKKLELLKHAIDVLIFMFDLTITVEIKDVYFDIGQDWKWTTLIVHNTKEKSHNFDYQLLSPKQLENIIWGNAEIFASVYDEIKEYLLGKHYF